LRFFVHADTALPAGFGSSPAIKARHLAAPGALRQLPPPDLSSVELPMVFFARSDIVGMFYPYTPWVFMVLRFGGAISCAKTN
jgi:hypothetical protein